jgi:hypothetical protein
MSVSRFQGLKMNRLLAKGIQQLLRSTRLPATRLAAYSIDSKTHFASKHIGSNEKSIVEMLGALNCRSLDELTDQIVPKSISLNRALRLPPPQSKRSI